MNQLALDYELAMITRKEPLWSAWFMCTGQLLPPEAFNASSHPSQLHSSPADLTASIDAEIGTKTGC